MKKVILFIFVIVSAITIYSCKKTMYYACCDTGHAYWASDHRYDSPDATDIKYAKEDHDKAVHSGVVTARRCSSR